MRDTGVNGRGLPLNGGASCIHDLPPLYVGQRLDGAAGPLHRPPTGKAWQWAAWCQPDGNSDSLKPAARPNNTCLTIKRN
jgi:hypothetical protein